MRGLLWRRPPASVISCLPPSTMTASACSIRLIPTAKSPKRLTGRTLLLSWRRPVTASKYWNGEPTRPEWPVYLDYMELQLRELLTHYGDVALIWLDGLYHQEKYDGVRMARAIHELQPRTLINNRIGIPGDFETPEQFLPKTIPVKGHELDFNH